MNRWRGDNRSFLRLLFMAGLFLSLILAAKSGMSAETIDIDPDADLILKAMSSYLGQTERFSVNADIDFEVITRNGQKLQFSSYGSVVMERPAKFHITKKGLIVDAEVIYDGEILTLYGRNLNLYSRTNVSGTNDDAIRTYELETGIPAPGADLLFSDPYSILSSGVESAVYIGVTAVNGVECHHLAFREAKVDWQLWVKTGAEPLPMKYVITSKWLTGAPQYELRLYDWNTSPQIKDNEFVFTPPVDARRVEIMQVSETGEFISAGEGK